MTVHLDTHFPRTRSTLDHITLLRIFQQNIFQLFKEHYIWTEKVRAITIRAIDLIPQTTEEQLSLMVDYERRDRRVRLEDAIEDLRRRFGKKSLTYAGLLGNLKMPDDGRDSVKMPGLMYQ